MGNAASLRRFLLFPIAQVVQKAKFMYTKTGAFQRRTMEMGKYGARL